MPLDLYKVLEKGEPLSLEEHDQNFTAIEEAVKVIEDRIATIIVTDPGDPEDPGPVVIVPHKHDAADIDNGTLGVARLPAILQDFATLVQSTNGLPYFNTDTTMRTTYLTAHGRDLLEDSGPAAGRTTLEAVYRGAASNRISSLWTGTQAQYDALGSWDLETLYVVV
jgi:hypothetical protein